MMTASLRKSFVTIRLSVLASSLFLALIAAGCSYQAYRGAPLSSSEGAVLTVTNYRSVGAAWNAIVEEVDGTPTPWLLRESSNARNFLFNGPAGGEKTIDLEPGKHTIDVGLFWDQLFSGDSKDSKTHCTVSFDARPGGHYDLASAYWLSSFDQWFVGERDWTAWVVDARTGAVVSENNCASRTGVAMETTH